MNFKKEVFRSIGCLSLFLLACTTTRVETAGLPGQYTEERTPIFGLVASSRKDKRLSASYPPAELINGLKSYRQRYNSLPRTLSDLFNYSLESQKAVAHMLNTRYSNLQTNWIAPDTLEISYNYSIRTRDQKRNDTQIILNDKSYKRKYVFVYYPGDSSVFVENQNLK
ncbi:hypothetical protein ACLOAU_03040 [Niabella sp. CJ426]|uniref:hypothetical protein n=1 Tax=Niabella sp. CJ426 TaxID=3393740 RepID=UPI003CFDDCA0